MTKKVKILVCCVAATAVALTALVTPLAIKAANNSPPAGAQSQNTDATNSNNSNNPGGESPGPDTSLVPPERKIRATYLGKEFMGGFYWEIIEADLPEGLEIAYDLLTAEQKQKGVFIHRTSPNRFRIEGPHSGEIHLIFKGDLYIINL